MEECLRAKSHPQKLVLESETNFVLSAVEESLIGNCKSASLDDGCQTEQTNDHEIAIQQVFLVDNNFCIYNCIYL